MSEQSTIRERRWGARSVVSLLVFVIAALVLVPALIGHWGHRTVVDSDFTYLNDRLAAHYQIPGVDGVAMRRVKLPLAPGWRFMSMIVLLSLETGEVLGMLPDSYIQKMRVGGTTALVSVRLGGRAYARLRPA